MCPEIETLSAYYDGELERSDELSVKKHLDGCPECRRILSDMETLSDELQSCHSDEFASAQGAVWNNLTDIIEHEEYAKKAKALPFWHRRMQFSVPAAAALVALFVAVLTIGAAGFVLGRGVQSRTAVPELNITDASSAILSDEIFGGSPIEFDIPAVSDFIRAGEPLLIKEVDFRTMGGRN